MMKVVTLQVVLRFFVFFSTSSFCHSLSENASAQLTWDNNLKMLPKECKNVTFDLSTGLPLDSLILLNTTHMHTSSSGVDVVNYTDQFIFMRNTTEMSVEIESNVVGQIVILVKSNNSQISIPIESSHLRIYVIRSRVIKVINQVVGWVYFVAWSISFYPQVVLNFQRKSVIGLNFDYLAYNITGFIAYCLYNIGLFWIPSVQLEYVGEHPDGVIPVQPNDVFFTLHACLLTALTIGQCFVYERGGQRVSKVAIALLSVTWLAMFVLLFVAVGGKITWLTYLTVFSYVKLGVTLIKYLPQVYMNYQRKSTVGWSIGNVLLDFTGGSLSILQMILQSYNNDEWDLIFGDPTKFGLGVFSILFDVIFMVQHYVLYRPKRATGLLDEGSSDAEDE